MRLIFIFLLLLVHQITSAQRTIHGKAVRILDGDTFELLVNGNTTYKIRMTDIDAPEKKQDFGQVSRQQLAMYIFGKEVKVVYDKLDRNKRILGHVYAGKEYINLKMVEDGLAWHFKKYSKDRLFALAETHARRQYKGLWIKPDAIAPWDFRNKKK